jgi:hypothetical protein
VIRDYERQSNVWLFGLIAATIAIATLAVASGGIAVLVVVPFAVYIVALQLDALQFRALRAMSYIDVFFDPRAEDASAWEFDQQVFRGIWDKRTAYDDRAVVDDATTRILGTTLGGTSLLAFVLVLQSHLITLTVPGDERVRVITEVGTRMLVGRWLWFVLIGLSSVVAYARMKNQFRLYDPDGDRRAITKAWEETRERVAGGDADA